jgi:hypothetical protein
MKFIYYQNRVYISFPGEERTELTWTDSIGARLKNHGRKLNLNLELTNSGKGNIRIITDKSDIITSKIHDSLMKNQMKGETRYDSL